jgi:hypothetical protein
VQVGVGQQLAQGGQVLVRQLVAQQLGQLSMGASLARVVPQRRAPGAFRLREVAQFLAQPAQGGVGRGEVGVAVQGLAIVGLRLFEVTLLVPHAAQAAVGLGVSRVETQGQAVAGRGLVVLLLLGGKAGQVAVAARRAGIEL